MRIPRVFVSYCAAPNTPHDAGMAQQLIKDLQASGAEVVADAGTNTDPGFFQFLNQMLPTCQWLVIIQTPQALHSTRMQTTVSMALQLVAQKRMLGVLRFITEASNPQQVPAEWSALNAFDASQEYTRALQKLFFALTASDTMSSVPIPVPVAAAAVPQSNKAANKYDRPPKSLSRFRPYRTPQTESRRKRQRLALILSSIAALLILASGSTVYYFFFMPKAQPKAFTHPTDVIGLANFGNSGAANQTTRVHGAINDQVQIKLDNFTPPKPDMSYYAWLLGDRKQGDMGAHLLGPLTIHPGLAELLYLDPNQVNLLGQYSRILITQENSNPMPGVPSADPRARLYSAAIPQDQGQNAGGGDGLNCNGMADMAAKNNGNVGDNAQGTTALDYLRYLLACDPDPNLVNASGTNYGGVCFWMDNNIKQIVQWATLAKNGGMPVDQASIDILDYLDGVMYVGNDTPPIPANPDAANSSVSSVNGLLSDLGQNPAGYAMATQQYLTKLRNAPGMTQDQQALIDEMKMELDIVQTALTKIHTDAIMLFKQGPNTDITNDMFTQANQAMSGQAKGADWVLTNLQSLTTFTLKKNKE